MTLTEQPNQQWSRDPRLRNKKYTTAQREQNYAAALKMLKHLERDDGLLQSRAAAAQPDGLKSANYDGSRSSDISDPVHEAVVLRLTNGIRDPATRALSLAMEACRYLELADSERARALPPAPKPVDNTQDWCSNCTRYDVLEPRGRPKDVGQASTLCAWCHAFNREHHVLPPRPLVVKHGKRERIFDKDVVVALVEMLKESDQRASQASDVGPAEDVA